MTHGVLSRRETQVSDMEAARVRRFRRSCLEQIFGAKRAVTLRIASEAVADGVLSRRGRMWFGRLEALEAWLMGQRDAAAVKASAS